MSAGISALQEKLTKGVGMARDDQCLRIGENMLYRNTINI